MITQDDVNRLQSLLDRARIEGFGRAEVYLEYYRLLKDIPGTEEARKQILIQTYITTFSGALGGAALLGNAIAKFSDPDNYQTTLTVFTEDIIQGLIDAIVNDINRSDGDGDGVLTQRQIQLADSGVWDLRGLGQYFPGNIQFTDEGPDVLLSGGNLGAALAGYQLLFGGQVGFEEEDYPNAEWDRSNPDYDVLRDSRGRILYFEDKIGARETFFPSLLEDFPGASITAAAAIVEVLGISAFGRSFLFLQGIVGFILLSNEALRDGASTLIEEIGANFFSGPDTDENLRSLLANYTGINGVEFEETQDLRDEIFIDRFPLVLRNEGSFVDLDGPRIIFAYSDADVFAGNGEDFLIGFDEATIMGGVGDD